jgi:general stress protein 26
MATQLPAHADDIKKIGEFIQDIDFTMMTTIDEDGELHSRPMSTQNTEFDGNVYFFTFDDTDKTNHIARNPNVNLAYSAPDRNIYVSLKGEAQVLKDRQKMEELWNPALKVWFPQGLETPGIALIQVRVKTAEYWDSPSGTIAYVAALVKSAVTGKSPNMGDNETVKINP